MHYNCPFVFKITTNTQSLLYTVYFIHIGLKGYPFLSKIKTALPQRGVPERLTIIIKKNKNGGGPS
jgi:hypothetical protein